MMNSRLRFAVPVAAVAAGMLLAGCNSNSLAASASGTVSAAGGATSAASAPASSGTTAGSGTTTGSGSTAGSGSGSTAGSGTAGMPSDCTGDVLRIQYTDNAQIKSGALDGMSAADSVVTFTNIGSAPCGIGGYPGVAALDSSGKQVMQAVRTSDGGGGLITLAPNATASALISADTASCGSPTQIAGFLVTAPNLTTSTPLPRADTLCLSSLKVGQLHTGDTGGVNVG